MDNFKYAPFLKLKVNEVAGFAALSNEAKASLRPLFDLPRKKDISTEELVELIEKSSKKLRKYLKGHAYYIDNLDIPDTILTHGRNSYEFLLEKLTGEGAIPIIGLDRSPQRNQTVFEAKKKGILNSTEIAIRILPDEFTAFDAISDELNELISSGEGLFDQWTLIADARLCPQKTGPNIGITAGEFIRQAHRHIGFDRYIFTGSSIPPSISDIVKPTTEVAVNREELASIVRAREISGAHIILGDYTIVSPYYSDVDLPPEMLLNVMAPKLIYSHDDVQTVIRGGALKTHPRGSKQYNDIAASLVSRSFFRKSSYSTGDAWLQNNAVEGPKSITASSALAPTINAHMTYMCKDHPLAR